MKIGFLLFSPGISGGSYVVYEHASRLKRKGHQTCIITPKQVTAEDCAWHPSAHELDWLTLAQAEQETFDIVLATWWETFFQLRQLRSRQYVYFVQSIETRFFAPPDPRNFRNLELSIWKHLCEKTYACALPTITEARWIQEYIHNSYNNWPHLVRNGIRKDIYTAAGAAIAPRQPGRLRILVEGPVEIFFKNVPAAVRLAKEAGADEIWLLTSSNIQSFPDVDRIFSRVPVHETPPVYRSCDLVLKLSHVEGMFGPPLEMFHCGGTALVYEVTGHDEYIIHDKNAYVVPKDDEAQVVRLLRHLKENPAELERLKRGAATTAAAWPDWEACSAQFEQTLLAIAAGRAVKQEYLHRCIEELYSIPPPFIMAKMQEDLAAREKNEKEADQNNFISLSWDKEGKFTDEKLHWRHYLSGEWTTVTFDLQLDELPVFFRIIPSVKIGIVEISEICIANKTKGTKIIHLELPDEFGILYFIEKIRSFSETKNIFFVYGPKPSILLPELCLNSAEAGDQIHVSIRLKELSIQQFFAEQQQKKKHDEDKRFNTARLYWDSEGNFKRKKSLLQSYRSGEWVEICFELPVVELPLWLRLDPSRRTGILQFAWLVVRNTTQDREIMRFAAQEDFQRLFLTGDLKWIFSDRPDIALASGAEPMLILPRVEEEHACPGDMLELAVRLKEYGVQEFFDSYPLHFAQGSRPVAVSWRKRLLRLIRNSIGCKSAASFCS